MDAQQSYGPPDAVSPSSRAALLLWVLIVRDGTRAGNRRPA